MSNIKLTISNNNSPFEESQLKSIILFNKFSKETNNDDFIKQRLVYSIISQYSNGLTFNELTIKIQEKCGNSILVNEVKGLVKSLKDEFVQEKNGRICAKSHNEKFLQELNDKTNQLIDGIITKYKELSKQNVVHNYQTIQENIRRALSVFYKLSGLKFFNLQEDNIDLNNAVNEAITGLDKHSGQRLINAIGDTLSNPSESEKEVLSIWARAYVVTQLMKIDPTLQGYKQDKLKKKAFVIDTDVLLNALTKKCQYSESYKKMVEYLRNLGCELYIPNSVRYYVEGHIKDAINIVFMYGESQIREFDETVLVNSRDENVFVLDFVNIIKEEKYKKMTFDTYINNIYDPNDTQILNGCLQELIGQENINRDLPHIKLDEEYAGKLKDKIHEKTKDSAKGVLRTDKGNEMIAEEYTKLYLTILHCNDGNTDWRNEKNCNPPEKYYFITRSKKVRSSAKEANIPPQNIIVHPEAIIAAINELGDINNVGTEIINLFENPFLVSTANDIWNKIQPLIEQGAQLQYTDIRRLRIDVDKQLDGFLTGSNEDRIKLSKQFVQDGYLFPQTINNLSEKNEQLDKENQELKEKLKRVESELEKQNKQNKHDSRKNHYLQSLKKSKKKR